MEGSGYYRLARRLPRKGAASFDWLESTFSKHQPCKSVAMTPVALRSEPEVAITAFRIPKILLLSIRRRFAQ